MKQNEPIDARDKAYIDTHIDIAAEDSSQRAWIIWLVIAALSVAAIYAAKLAPVSDAIGLILAIGGCIGLLLFIAFLFTKAFGRGFWNGPHIGWW
jgi:hypothetical protein